MGITEGRLVVAVVVVTVVEVLVRFPVERAVVVLITAVVVLVAVV